MKIRILNAESDLEHFQSIRKQAIINSPDSFGESKEQMLLKTQKDYRKMLSCHGIHDFVVGAFVDDNLVGIAGFYHINNGNMAHKGWIWGVYVHPEYRNNGIANSLLTELLRRVKTIGKAKYIKLSVVTQNVSALRVYKKLGFSVYGTEPCALLVP